MVKCPRCQAEVHPAQLKVPVLNRRKWGAVGAMMRECPVCHKMAPADRFANASLTVQGVMELH